MEERIKEILGEVKGKPNLAQELSNDADILNDLGLDSLEMISFVLRIVEEFQIDFDALDYSHLSSIGSLCQFISQGSVVYC